VRTGRASIVAVLTPADDAEIRGAQRARLGQLTRTILLLMVAVPGPGTVALYLLHLWLAPAWQFRVLLGLAIAMWAAFAASWALARRGALEAGAAIGFGSVWAFATAVAVLRAGTLPTAALAWIAVLVLVYVVVPRWTIPASVLVLGTFAAIRLLAHAGALPVADPPPLVSLLYDLGLAIAIVPTVAVGLRASAAVAAAPIEALHESSAAQRRTLDTVGRVQPDLERMAADAARGASELATSAGQQATTAGRVAAATAELEQLLARAAEAAGEARRVADATRASSIQASERLDEVERQLAAFQGELAAMVASVEALSRRSSGTEQVIEAVEDVHASVKVLALNAALEASRAGDAGRGLGVVAGEMRAMIESTESGVREGRTLLGAIRTDAEATIRRAQDSARRLDDHLRALQATRELVRGILDGFGDTARSLDTIARGGDEQRRHVELVARAMRDLSASTASLEGLAADLQDSVTRFAAGQAEMAALVGEREA
jgi:methyl-accepting chemotaxis protein